MGPAGEMISGVDQDTKLSFTCVNSPSLMAEHFVSAVVFIRIRRLSFI